MTTENRNPNDPQGTGHMSEAGRTAENEARKLGADARQEARKLQDKASEAVRSRAEDAKDTMAEEVSSVGKAFRTASGESNLSYVSSETKSDQGLQSEED